jgi:hypothetical protein
MLIAKRIGLAVLSPLFILLLFATAFDIGFARTATHPATVKRLVAESGIYGSVVPSLLQQTKTISTSYGTVSTTDPVIAKAANSALSPPFIQQNTEMAIDNVYDWLNGKIAQPNFKIDLSGSKTLFANKVTDAVEARLSSLPACSAAQSRAIARSGQFDTFSASCSPVGTDPDAIAGQLKSALLSQQDFLSNTVIDPSRVKNGGSSQSVFNGQLKDAPKQYQRLKKTPVILSLLTILSGIGIVFLSRSWQVGLRRVGISLLIIGLVMLILAWTINRTVSTKIAPKIKVDNTVLQADIRNLVTDLSRQIDKNYWVFGGLYTLLGAAAIGGAEFYRRRQPVPSELNKAPPSGGGTKPDPAEKL